MPLPLQEQFRAGRAGRFPSHLSVALACLAGVAAVPCHGQDAWLQARASSQPLFGICWGADTFVAVGNNGTIVSSPDGATWAARTSGTTAALYSVTFGGSRFVAVGERGTVLSSSDGRSWIRMEGVTTQTFTGVAYGNDRFLAVGDGPAIVTSSDAIRWTSRALPGITSLRGISHAYSQFVLTGAGGAVRTTPDGALFNSRTTGTTDYIEGITYGQHRFLAVGRSGNAYTSTDGQTFVPAPRPAAAEPGALRCATFFENLFLVGGEGGALFTSPDATIWTRRTVAGLTQTIPAISSSPSVAVMVTEAGDVWRLAGGTRPPAIAVPPAPQTAYIGGTAALVVVATGSNPLRYQWNLEGRPVTGATTDVLLLPSVGTSDAGAYTVTVSNALGQATSIAASLAVDQAPLNPLIAPPLLDPDFVPAIPFGQNSSAAVELTGSRLLIAMTPDASGTPASNPLLMLQSNGRPDPSSPPVLSAGARVDNFFRTPDGSILMVGAFSTVDGVARRNLARLFADGTFDPSFAPPDTLDLSGHARFAFYPDGAILIAGGGDGKRLQRLTPNGTPDPNFRGEVLLQGNAAVIRAAAVSSSGRIFVAATAADGQTSLLRLQSNGTLDPAYAPFALGARTDVPLLAFGPQDRLVFVRVGEDETPSVGTLDANGASDALTGAETSALAFRAAALEPDGRLLVSVWSTSPPATGASLLRFDRNGRRDPSIEFPGKADGAITRIVPRRAGGILVLGEFTAIEGVGRPGLARLMTFNRIVSGPTLITAVDPAVLTVRTGQRLKMALQGANLRPAPNALSWVDAAGRRLDSGVSDANPGQEFAFATPGTFYVAGRVTAADATVVQSPYARIEAVDTPFPLLLEQTSSQSVLDGTSLRLEVSAAGNAISYQWSRNGRAIPGATLASLDTGPIAEGDTSTYAITISNAAGAVSGAPIQVTGITAPPRLTNLSVRTYAGAGEDTLIAGFTLAGGAGNLLVRAVGPGLAEFGVTDAMGDPKLTTFIGAVRIAENDDWGGAALVNIFNGAGAFALSPSSKDAAIAFPVSAFPYTVQVQPAKGSGPGTALVEVYDAGSIARLVNLSARTVVSAARPLTAGFVIADPNRFPGRSKPVLVRAVGPTLANFGVNGVLPALRLEVFRAEGSASLATNEGWSTALNASEVAASAARAGAFPLPLGSRDAALLLNLTPGAYTAQIIPVGNVTGAALVEVYEVP